MGSVATFSEFFSQCYNREDAVEYGQLYSAYLEVVGKVSVGCRCGIPDGGGAGGPGDGDVVGRFSDGIDQPLSVEASSGVYARGLAGLGSFAPVGLGVGSAEPIPSGGVPGVRGPNYLRNQAARMRKKVQKEESRLALAEAKGRADAKRELLGSLSWRSRGAQVPDRSPEEEKLRQLKLERQIIQETRKLDKLKSPTQIIEDAMRMVTFAERCAKSANDNKVAAWAASLSEASALSIARSGALPSVETVSSGRARSIVEKGLQFSVKPMNSSEKVAVDLRILTRKELFDARIKCGRELGPSDFTRDDCPFLVTDEQAYYINRGKI